MSKPLLEVEVAALVIDRLPALMSSPPLEESPAPPTAAIPELKVEVAAVPPTFNTPWIVELAPMIADDEALSNPRTWRLDPKVEEAEAMKPLVVTNPLTVSTVKMDEDAEFKTRNALVVLMKVCNVVEPYTERVDGVPVIVVVPMPSWLVALFNARNEESMVLAAE